MCVRTWYRSMSLCTEPGFRSLRLLTVCHCIFVFSVTALSHLCYLVLRLSFLLLNGMVFSCHVISVTTTVTCVGIYSFHTPLWMNISVFRLLVKSESGFRRHLKTFLFSTCGLSHLIDFLRCLSSFVYGDLLVLAVL